MNTSFDIFDSYDIAATEANISVAEYVMESAQFEIDNGNTEYAVILEEAEAAAEKENGNLFQKIKKKVTDFCRTAIAKIKNVLSAIANRMRVRKSTKMDTKLAKLDADKAIHPSSTDWIIINNANLPSSVKVDGCSVGIAALFNEFKSNVQAIMNDPKSVSNLNIMKVKAQMLPFSDSFIKKASKKVSDTTFSVNQVRLYLNECIKYLQTLMDMIPMAEAAASQAKNNGVDVAAGRSAVASLISFMTSYVNAYYKALMRVSKSLITGREIGHGDVTTAHLTGRDAQ